MRNMVQLFYFFATLTNRLKKRQKKPIERIIAQFEPIRRIIKIERGTIRHMCAVDSLMTIVESDHDIDVFSDNGDLELYDEYCRFVNANKKAIDKEESKPYRY